MSNRKLQGEIERVLKKVDEGVQVFEQIWDKVYSATTTAQKEKYEGDLKKEIKKLQRLRDQIKTWQGDSSIKDKSKLDANRKLIEEKMEKFKVCEKETKTKAFSKEGLAQERIDPKQKAKSQAEQWIQAAINRLGEQSDGMEAEIESMNSGKRKKRGEENPRVTQLKENMSRHNYHATMLERVLRAVLNENVSPEQAEDLKESVDYYTECNQDPDFVEDDEMYDTLNLSATPAPSATKRGGKGRERENEPEELPDDDIASPVTMPPPKKGPASPRGTKATKPTAANPIPSSKPSATPVPSGRVTSPKALRGDRSPPHGSPQSPRSGANGFNARETSNARNGASQSAPLLSTVVKGSAPLTSENIVHSNSEPRDLQASQETSKKPTVEAPYPVRSATAPLPQQQPRSGEEDNVQDMNPAQSAGPVNPPVPEGATVRMADEEPRVTKLTPMLDVMDPKLAAIEAALKYMPEAPTALQKTNTPNAQQRQAENDALTSGGSSTPRHPVKVPASFPSVLAPVFDSKEVFEQFDPDTLFFIFYYQQGTYQQYLAATELKRQGWRFHKKYLTWFQRHDEPKLSTDEYETGTFIYFDYANVVVQGEGTGWCQRIKSEFVFEYRFLEDELV